MKYMLLFSHTFNRRFILAAALRSFHTNSPSMLVNLLKRVGKYIDTEEFLKSKSSGFGDYESTKAKRKHESSERGSGKKQKQDQQKTAGDPALIAFMPLSRPI